MCPSNQTDTTEHLLHDFGSTVFDGSCFPNINGLTSPPCQSPSMFLFDGDLDKFLTGCNDVKSAERLEAGLPGPSSQTEDAEECQVAVIPLTVLELEPDDAAIASPERTFSAMDDILVTSLSVPDNSKQVRGGVRHSKSLPGSSGGPKSTIARNSSITSPLISPSRRCGPEDYTKNQMDAQSFAEMSSEVPKLKLERRRAQNRKAANRCRHKRKLEEDQLKRDFESTEKNNNLKRKEIHDLLSQIKRLKTELHRHVSTDLCFHQATPQQL